MKRMITLIITLCMVASLTMPLASAASSGTSAQDVVGALGIITGDENGNLNLSSYVTRAQFAKMMICASKYKDSVSSSSSSSPFKDVKYTHWAASYVQQAVTAGWITGYTDGSFRPDNYVKLEEAATAVLKMLGYTSTDFSGSFPEAQINKYSALGLNENISTSQGSNLTREDCVNLFYNLMGTKNTSSVYYAVSLGYTVNDAGEIDYSSLVSTNMKGPFIVSSSSWTSSLPFSASSAVVYRNGALSSLSAISTYDVYYYNTSMNTVWAYSNRVTGTYTAASPNSSSPTSVTVAGNSYTIETSAAAYALSDIGSYKVGDTVTLLLGKNGYVAGVMAASSLNYNKYGLIVGTGTQSYSDASGNTYKYSTVTVACTDGSTYQYEFDGTSSSIGSVARISVTSGVATVSLLSSSGLSGTVNSTGTKLGSYYFADDIEILDTTKNGSYVKVYPSRLAGITLDSGDIRYYVLDSNGKISRLILNDVTGDLYSYCVLTGVSETTTTGTYKYILDGTSSSCSSSKMYGVSTGPALMEKVDSSVVNLKNLTKVSLTSLGSQYVFSSSTQYTLASEVAVYVLNYGTYTISSISDLSNLGNGYSFYGYYDKAESDGGRIRMIIASN